MLNKQDELLGRGNEAPTEVQPTSIDSSSNTLPTQTALQPSTGASAPKVPEAEVPVPVAPTSKAGRGRATSSSNTLQTPTLKISGQDQADSGRPLSEIDLAREFELARRKSTDNITGKV